MLFEAVGLNLAHAETLGAIIAVFIASLVALIVRLTSRNRE